MLTHHWLAWLFGLLGLFFAVLSMRNRYRSERNPVAARAQLRTGLIFILVALFLWLWY